MDINALTVRGQPNFSRRMEIFLETTSLLMFLANWDVISDAFLHCVAPVVKWAVCKDVTNMFRRFHNAATD